MERWYGRYALVTGASSEIGTAIAKELVQRGMIVFGCGWNIEKLQALSVEVTNAPGKLYFMKCNLTDRSQILEMFSKIRYITDKIDVCINNVGVNKFSPRVTEENEKWADMFEVNIRGLCVCTCGVVKLMKEKQITDGQIINMGSIGAPVLNDSPDQVGFKIYCDTKSIIRLVTERLNQKIKAITTCIRVSSITVGVVETELLNQKLGPEKAKELYAVMGSPQTDGILEAMIYILSTPPHVEISDIVVQAKKSQTSHSEDNPKLTD